MTKSGYWVLSILAILMVASVGGCRRAGKWLVKENTPVRADAMVLLMGNFPDRVLHAVDLYRSGTAGKVLIAEESMGPFSTLEARGAEILSNTEQARNASVALGVPPGSIIVLPGEARSTMDEAIIIRNYINSMPDTDTLLLVSSASHMRRASMIFNAAFRKSDRPVYIACSPSSYSGFNPEKWWRNREEVQAVMYEYIKIVSFVLFERRKFTRE